uniref:Secreted protein n=1 Tax=Anguilla anguilla TaxID=7936 RepID=A0A0E9WQ31_ANGAN
MAVGSSLLIRVCVRAFYSTCMTQSDCVKCVPGSVLLSLEDLCTGVHNKGWSVLGFHAKCLLFGI